MLLGEFGFSDGAARAALTRLVRRELIARVRSGRLVHYRLTPRCERLLIEGDGRIFTLGRLPRAPARGPCSGTRSPRTAGSSGPGWGGGFGSSGSARCRTASGSRRTITRPRSSICSASWVWPSSPRCSSSRVGPAAASGLPALVARAWDLSGLEDRYEAFCSAFEPLPGCAAPPPWRDREAFLVRTRLCTCSAGSPSSTRSCPRTLAPLSGSRTRAAEIFEALYTGLAAASQRHFDAVTRPVGRRRLS